MFEAKPKFKPGDTVIGHVHGMDHKLRIVTHHFQDQGCRKVAYVVTPLERQVFMAFDDTVPESNIKGKL
jgi:hypothetical protein